MSEAKQAIEEFDRIFIHAARRLGMDDRQIKRQLLENPVRQQLVRAAVEYEALRPAPKSITHE